MTEQHVGKKRRKEVREAINMKKQIRKDFTFMMVVFGIAIIVTLACTALAYQGLFGDNMMLVQTVPLVIVFGAVMIMSFRMNSFWELRSQYKKHCQKCNITKSGMKALENGEL